MSQQEEYKRVLSELIHKQMTVLGSDITLTKVSNVDEIQIDESGNVTEIAGDPQVALQKLIDEFVELSGLIVKKTMESIVNSSQRNGLESASRKEGEHGRAMRVTQNNVSHERETPSQYSSDVVNTIHKALADLNKNQ